MKRIFILALMVALLVALATPAFAVTTPGAAAYGIYKAACTNPAGGPLNAPTPPITVNCPD
jgi:hypothetical protein